MRKTELKPLPMGIIREALELDPGSPTYLRWKTRRRHHFKNEREWKRWNTRYAGCVAGGELTCVNGKKYWKVCVDNIVYGTHRIVYALATGADPAEMHIDHIDGNGQNNSPSNLRLATNAENLRNRGTYRNNTSGRKGVSWYKPDRKWQAYISFNGRMRHIGYFNDIDDAAAAYDAAARKYFGEFYREEKTK